MRINNLNFNQTNNSLNNKSNTVYYIKTGCKFDTFVKNNTISFAGYLLFNDISQIINKGDLDSIKKLPDLYVVNKNAKSLLHVSAEGEQLPISKFLLEEGLDINQKDKKGNTPFNIACSTQNEELVDLFLGYKPDVNTQDEVGRTPLLNSIQNEKIVEKLLENGANPNTKDKWGTPILFESIKTPPLLYLLLSILTPQQVWAD